MRRLFFYRFIFALVAFVSVTLIRSGYYYLTPSYRLTNFLTSAGIVAVLFALFWVGLIVCLRLLFSIANKFGPTPFWQVLIVAETVSLYMYLLFAFSFYYYFAEKPGAEIWINGQFGRELVIKGEFTAAGLREAIISISSATLTAVVIHCLGTIYILFASSKSTSSN